MSSSDSPGMLPQGRSNQSRHRRRSRPLNKVASPSSPPPAYRAKHRNRSFLVASSSSTNSSSDSEDDDQLGSSGTQRIGTEIPTTVTTQMASESRTRAFASVPSSLSAPSSPTPRRKPFTLETRARSSSTTSPSGRLGPVTPLSAWNSPTLRIPASSFPPVSLDLGLALKSTSYPRLSDMNEQSSHSPPPYSPPDDGVHNDFNFPYPPGVGIGPGPSQPRLDLDQSHVSASSSRNSHPHLPYASALNPLSNSSSPTSINPYLHTRNHNQSLPHLRKRSAAGSGPSSRFPSPMNSETEDEEGAIYTSSRIRLHHSSAAPSNATMNGNGNAPMQENTDEYSSSSTIQPTKGKGKSKKTWSWRHWVFALAAGIVGFGDVDDYGRDSERAEKVICTTPGHVCAGETETETDEPSRHLPTARIVPSSELSPHDFRYRLIEFLRLLAIVPAVFGTLWNLYQMFFPPNINGDDLGAWGRKVPPDRVDFFVAALWSILTGYQCLALTTGLLRRWQAYYPLLPTLIRLLALQGICWPATQITLSVLDATRRPVICWCLIGTTTCASRSVQIWVTSNIVLEGEGGEAKCSTLTMNSHAIRPHTHLNIASPLRPQTTRIQPPRRRWTYISRHWDWKEIGVKCVLPAGIVYFVMAWLGEVRREWLGC